MHSSNLGDQIQSAPLVGWKLRPSVLGVCIALSTLSYSAVAENIDKEEDAKSKSTDIEQILVVGSARGKSVVKSSTAVTYLGNEDLSKISVRSNPAEVLKAIPGISIELSGNSDFNLMSRGFPQNFSPAGNIYVQIREDGLPILENPLFVDAQYFSTGPGLANVQGVRGSTAGIWGTNSPGALLNFVTKEGGPDFEGQINATYGFQGLYNLQSNISGPMAGLEDTYYSLSANYIYDKGIRDRPSWPLNEGGEIFGNIVTDLDNGRLKLSAKVKNKTAHQTRPGIVNFSSNGGFEERPEYDIASDSFVVNDFDLYSIPQPGGTTQNRKLSDGNTVDFYYVGAKLELDLTDKIESTTQFRFTEGNVSTDIDINLSNESISDFANGIANDINASTWRVEYLFPQTGDLPYGPNYEDPSQIGGNGLWASGVHITWDWHNTNWFFTQQFDYIEENNVLSTQLYVSSFTRERTGSFQNLFHEASGNPRSLNLVLEGVEVSPGVFGEVAGTSNGFAQYGTNYTNENLESLVVALIVEDEYQLTDDIELSASIRHEYKDISINQEASTPIDLDGDPLTAYDNNYLVGTGSFNLVEDDFSETAWTAAANYQVTDNVGMFLRYSDLFLSTTIDDGIGTDTQDIDMWELGVKYNSEDLFLFATFFLADLKGIPDTRFTFDDNGNLVETISFGGAETMGLELNGKYYFTDEFYVDTSLTLLDADYVDRFVEGPDGESIDVTGNQVIRQPKVNLRLAPTWRINDEVEAFASIQHFGDRTGNESNTTTFDAYTLVDVGLTWNVTEDFFISAIVINALDEAGQQEGSVQEGNAIGGNVQDVITLGRFTDGISSQITVGLSF
jgi:hypothetical protein